MSVETEANEVQNRWRHAPSLHPQSTSRRASWLEVLFDIVVAGAMTAAGTAVGDGTVVGTYMPFLLEFSAIFFAWTAFTFFQNRFSVDDLMHRLLTFGLMLAIALLGLTSARALSGDTRTFSWSYVAIDSVLALLYARTYISIVEARDFTRHYGTRYAIGAGLWVVAALVPQRWVFVCWCAGAGLGLSFPMSRRGRELAVDRPPDARHLSERYGLITSMVLGQGLLAVLSVLVSNTTRLMPAVVALVLLLFCSIWWLYFDDVARSSIRTERAAPFVWIYGHLPFLLGLVTLAAGIRRLVRLDVDAPMDTPVRALLAGGLGLTLLSLALIDSVTERRTAELGDRARVNARIAAALLSLLLYPIGSTFGPVGLLCLATVPCVAQVAFDLMMAPLAASYVQAAQESVLELARVRFREPKPINSRLARVGEAVRKGAPSELKRDFYSFFMEGPWSRLVVSLVFIYLTINATFAGLYLLEPGAIGGAHSRSFADAFYFSVQTFSTIGYGVLTPATPYGNLVVTAEAAVGLLAAAFATGLMFAKAARPHSGTLFSNVFVVTRRNGVPTVTFRVGNARGNDVVDASVTVTVLKSEVSQEGEQLRRMYELPLVRSRSPIFTMTWVVMHHVTDDSPLAGVNWLDPELSLAIIVTIVGHDGTYGQTTYARHLYYPENARVGQRFVDVMSQLPDGRMAIDYSRFHDTVADGTASLPPTSG
ncbi:MAG TPA: low temperature requirement protein A [Polyangiaceae bacterium]|jgi:inward rectifier potassium channel|nr:low temperature requirement protein A [Polyangiaceae bacterium]